MKINKKLEDFILEIKTDIEEKHTYNVVLEKEFKREHSNEYNELYTEYVYSVRIFKRYTKE